MKKIVALLCSLTLVFSLFSVSTFAASAETSNDVVAVNPESSAGARATSLGLWYEEDMLLVATGIQNMPVTPEKGANLRMWLDHTGGPVQITIAYTNWLGGYTHLDTLTFEPGERDVLLVENCNGKKYLVQMTAPDLYVSYSILLYQN